MAVQIEHVIARNLKRLREERGWTQADFSTQMWLRGASWSPNRVAQIETLRTRMSLSEIFLLMVTLNVSMSELLAGDDEIIASQSVYPLHMVRAGFEGSPTEALQQWERQEGEYAVETGETLRKIGVRSGLTPRELDQLAQITYGHGIVAERDSRTGDDRDLSKRSAQTKRGHATRAILAELTAIIEQDGPDQVQEQVSKAMP